MKVLYIGHYREATGWAQAAIDYILAMDSVGVEVVCKNVSLTQWNEDIPQRIKELENKNSEGCNICIQHLLPHHLVGTQLLDKNIALFVSESASVKMNAWFVQLQQMDEVWVPNTEMKNAFLEDKLMASERIKVIPHTFDLSKYTKQYRNMHIPNSDYRFKFYYVGDVNDRKNLVSIIRCFYSEFDRSEPVSLILKVNKFGQSPESIDGAVNQLCNNMKTRLRMYQTTDDYPPIVVIPHRLSEDELNSLHQYADCFLCPSHGEGWSIPSFEAMCFGNTPICSEAGGPRDYINPDDLATGSLVSGQYGVCDCGDSAFSDIFTGREEWFTPDESKIKKAMRYYYENREQVDRKAGLTQGEQFSYEKIGNRIKEHLEGQHV
jgi:glycosyltransferase involved in cell wall biosynthesis